MDLTHHISAIVPAAGSSERMGAGDNKLFRKVSGTPAVRRTVERLRASRHIGLIVVCVREADLKLVGSMLSGIARVKVIPGGATRQASVLNGLAAVKDTESIDQEAYVLIHDAARCNVSTELIDRAIQAANEHEAVTAGVPVRDSLTRVNRKRVVMGSIDRSEVWLVQTPQVFRFDLIERAHKNARPGATDDASLVEAIHPVFMIEGERTNIKLTYPEDFHVIESLDS